LGDIDGVKLHVAECGIKYKNRPDLFIATFDEGTVVAGTLTKSTTCSPSVMWDREALKGGVARGLIVNAGNANAFTGEDGKAAVEKTVSALAAKIGCAKEQVFASSTGVIGVKLPTEKIIPNIEKALSKAATWAEAALAITTTDTFTKMAIAEIDGVKIFGIAKGSGMIEPNMATLLCYIFTDAKISATELQKLVSAATDKSFNCITVDSDTSTSDTLLVFATNKKSISDMQKFAAALQALMTDLAQQVVRDGEGAKKFIEVNVNNAASDSSAKKIAKSIANSPLIKTAIAGEDANWGRVIMAIGKTEEAVDLCKIKISFGNNLVTENGAVAAVYDEAKITEYIKGDEIAINVDLGAGAACATVWTCDLTHEYIAINADYRS